MVACTRFRLIVITRSVYQCTKAGHATCLERSYRELNVKVIGCGTKVFGTTTNKGKNIPGWNLYVNAPYD